MTDTEDGGLHADALASIHVENIGGIAECDATVPPGGAILTGRNATNRTSLLRAINAALGGSAATLKSDADDGSVTLEIDGETYSRTFVRTESGTTVDGSPYTDDAALVDGFACLLEDTPARRAVERGEDLRPVIMEPVDTAEIEREVERLSALRDDLDAEIAEAERRADRIPSLEERRSKIRSEIDTLDETLSDLQETVETFDADADGASEAEALVEAVEEKRHRLEDRHTQIDHQESTLESLRAERESIAAKLDDVERPDEDPVELERRLDDRRERKRRVEGTIVDLTRIVDFNEELLDGGVDPVSSDGAGDVTDALDPASGTVECWTCGSEVERDDVAERLDGIRAVIEEKRAERDGLEAEVEGIQSRLSTLDKLERRESTLRSKLDDVDRQIEHREGKLAELADGVESLAEEVAEGQRRVEETEELRNGDVLETYQRLSDLQYERGKLEGELADVEEEIEACEAAAEAVEDRQERREVLGAEITSYRTKIDDLERTAVEAFNEHMESVLDRLQYENVERVWLERRSRGGSRESTFELHVVRRSDDGPVYEDRIRNLSESEREVVGLVVALAGFLTHEVYEEVPVMLLDSLEAIDADRIASLVEYLSGFVPHLVVALLPEDERALPDDFARIEADEILA